jgi:hypothetical protein
MEINDTPTQIKVQNLCIAGCIITEEKQLTKIHLGFEKNCNRLKSM